jgi:ABC-type dipeptide/oligopeptide/nickel transport system permease component
VIRFLGARVLGAALVLWVVASLTFLAVMASGDPITAALQSTGASPEMIDQVRTELGYDRPLAVQYVDFLAHAVRGDFGESFRYGKDAMGLVAGRLPNTIALALAALAVTVALGVPLALAASWRPNSPVDRLVSLVCAGGQAIPNFVLGPVLLLVFAVAIPLFPVSGTTAPFAIVLPALTLAAYPVARLVRVLRAGILEARSADYVRTARSKGLRPSRIVSRHVLANAMLPSVTVLGLQVAGTLGGAVVVETVFSWPGVGSLARDALMSSDVNLALAVVVAFAAAVLVVNLVTDAVYALVDPRIRLT